MGVKGATVTLHSWRDNLWSDRTWYARRKYCPPQSSHEAPVIFVGSRSAAGPGSPELSHELTLSLPKSYGIQEGTLRMLVRRGHKIMPARLYMNIGMVYKG